MEVLAFLVGLVLFGIVVAMPFVNAATLREVASQQEHARKHLERLLRLVQAFGRQWVAALALGLAFFYAVHVATLLQRRLVDRNLLVSFLGLASFFLTLSMPLVLSAEWVTASWAVQAVVMLWMADRIGSRFLRGAGRPHHGAQPICLSIQVPMTDSHPLSRRIAARLYSPFRRWLVRVALQWSPWLCYFLARGTQGRSRDGGLRGGGCHRASRS